jgi:hypothetical protein
MPEQFDPYRKWLGIPLKDQPPNHYRLLAIELFEDDRDVISDAVEQRMAHVRSYQLGQYMAMSQKVLNELATAKACLLDPQKKATYDEILRTTRAQSNTATGGVPQRLIETLKKSMQSRTRWAILGAGGLALVVFLLLATWGNHGDKDLASLPVAPAQGPVASQAEPPKSTEQPQPQPKAKDDRKPESGPERISEPKPDPRSDAPTKANPGSVEPKQPEAKPPDPAPKVEPAATNGAVGSQSPAKPESPSPAKDGQPAAGSEEESDQSDTAKAKSPAESKASARSASFFTGRFQVNLVKHSGKGQESSIWDIRGDNTVWENDRQIATWNIERSQLQIEFSDNALGKAVVRRKGKDAASGTQTRLNGEAWSCMLQRLYVISTWEHKAGRNPPSTVVLWSNGHLNKPDGPGTWSKNGLHLRFKWPRFVDNLTLSPDLRSYHGKNQKGTRITGRLVSDQGL